MTRTRMSRTVAAAASAIAIATSACGGPPSRPNPPATAPDPVAEHIQARGGSAAIRRIKAMELKLDLVEPKFALRAEYLVNRAGCMRIDVFDGAAYLQSEGVSPEGGYAVAAGDVAFAAQPRDGVQTLQHGVESPLRLFGLDEFSARGHSVSLDGKQPIGGVAYDKVTVRYRDGYTADLFMDPSTHLIAKVREQKPMHLAVDPKKRSIETQLSDYRDVSGVKFPFFSREVDWLTGEELGHTTVLSIAIDSEKALAACTRPALPRK